MIVQSPTALKYRRFSFEQEIEQMKKCFLWTLVAFLAGCSSIINGTTQEISFAGNVKGIKIKQNGFFLCSTPCSVNMERLKNGSMITAEKEGYDTSAVMLKTKLSFFFWGNFITGGLLGATTDAVSCAEKIDAEEEE